MSTSNLLSEREKKRCLIQIMEAEDNQGFNLHSLFRDRDDFDTREVSFGIFKNCLEKVLPSITREEVMSLFQEFQTPGHEKSNYEMLLGRLNSYRKKKKILTDILDQIMDNFSSKDNTLFDLFETADKDKNGSLSKKEFLNVIDNFGIYYDEDQMDDFFFFLDNNNDGNISYKELNTYFTKYVKNKGKDINDLTRSSFFKDPKGYWGRKIFQEAHKYITQNRTTVPQFFKQYGMESDFSISQYEFTEAMGVLIRNLDKNDLYKLVNEMDDKSTNKISISKFQDVFNAIASENPDFRRTGEDKEFEQNKKYNEILKTLGAAVSSKYFSYDDFFVKYGYNRHLKTINESKFDQAIFDLDLRFPPDDIRLLKSKLDPSKSGIMALDDLFEIKPDSSIQNQYIGQTLNPREKTELKSLLDEITLRTEKQSINLMAQFNKYDFRNEGQLSNDEFIMILKDNKMGLGAQDQDLLLKAYGDSKTRKVNYKQFYSALQDNLKDSRLAQSTFLPEKTVDPILLEEKEKALYQAIRDQYATMEDLFVAYDRNGDNTISKPEFIQMLKTLKLDTTTEVMEALYDKIDNKKIGKIYFVNITLHFKSYIEADCKNIINLIIRAFVNDNRSYFDVLKNFPQSGNYMKFIDFMDALQSLSRKITLKDIQFLLSYLNIKLNPQREINWDEFGIAIQSAAKRLNVMNPMEEERIFRKTERQVSFREQPGSPSGSPTKKGSGILDKLKIKLGLNSKEKILDFWRMLDRDNNKKASLSEFKRTVNLMNPNFTDAELNQAFREFDIYDRGSFTSSDLLERLSSDQQINLDRSQLSPKEMKGLGESRFGTQEIIDKTMWAKTIFINIHEMLQRKGETFNSYFQSPDRKMNIIETKLKLSRLEVNMNSEVTQLLNDICDEQQPNLVNLNYFEKCYNYHKDKYELDNVRMKTPIDSYAEIRDVLKKKGLTFDDSFAKSDIGNRGYISVGTLRSIISDDLRIYLDPETMRKIINETSDSEGRISLNKLRDGVGLNRRNDDFPPEKDSNIEDLLKSLRLAMKNNDMTVDRLFNLFDVNKDKIVEWDEFQKMMLKLNGSLTRTEMLKLFKFMDKNGNGQISPIEFRNSLEDGNDKADRAVKALKDLIQRNKFDTERAFDMFDKNSSGTIEFSELSEVLNNIDNSLSLEEKRFIFKKLDNNQDGKITKSEFMKQFGTGVPQSSSTQANNARTRRQIDDIKNSLRVKNRSETIQLFEMIDANQNGKVSPNEFIQFVKTINPSISTSEAFEMFKIIDLNGNEVITFDEFEREFNVNKFEMEREKRGARPQEYREQTGTGDFIEKTRFASNLFEEIGFLLRIEQLQFNDHFFSYDNKIEKATFKKKFESLGYGPSQLSQEDFDRLFRILEDSHEFDKINLNEFQRCFNYYKDGRKLDIESFKKQRLNQIVRDIKNGLNKEDLSISRIITNLDRSGYGTCNLNDFQNTLTDRLNVPKNTNLKILCEAVAKDDDKRTINLNKFENLVSDGFQERRYDDRRYDEETYKRSTPSYGQDDTYFRREADYSGDQAFKGSRPGDNYQDPKTLLDKVKSDIERSGIGIEQIYKRFNPSGADFITYDDFYKGLKNLNQDLTREDIQSIFSLLDKERVGRISKFKFMTSLGKIAPGDIPMFLSWAKPIFQDINKHLEDSRSDLYRIMKPHKGQIEKNNFRQGLYLIGLDIDKYNKDLQNITEVLLEGRNEGVNFDALEACLQKAKQPDAPQWTKKANFTDDELGKINKMFQEIAKFMKVDNITFETLIQSKDKRKQGWITEAELKDILLNELYITENPVLDLLIEYSKDPQGNIDLLRFRDNLKKGDQAIAPTMSLDAFLKELKDRFKNDIESLIKFFDENNNQNLSRREFVECCKRALNTDKELALFYFSQMDKNNQGNITITEFRDFLDAGQPNFRQYFSKLREFVIQNKNYLLKSLDSLDDSRSQLLTLSQIKIAFSNSQFNITLEQLEDIVNKIGLRKDTYNRYNYWEFVDRIVKTDQEKQDLSDIDAILNRLKAQVLAKNVDLIPIFNKHDTRGDHMISVKEAFEDLGIIGIFLTKDEKDLLLPLLHPLNDRINYYDFSRLIFNGRDKSQTKDILLKEAAWAKDLVLEIKDRMRKKGLTTVKLFGLRPNEEFIPVQDFENGLEYINFRRNSPEVRDLGHLIVAQDRPGQVSMLKFEYLLENIQEASHSLTAEELKTLDQRFSEIRSFMKEDNKTYDQIFPKYDRNRTGFVSREEMARILSNELGLDSTPQLERFLQLMSDKRGMISLEYIKTNLDVPSSMNVASNRNEPYGTTSTRNEPQNVSSIRQEVPKFTNVSQAQAIQTTNTQYRQPQNISAPNQRSDEQSRYTGTPGGYSNPSVQNPQYHSGSLADLSSKEEGPIEFSGDLVVDIKKYFRMRRFTNAERFAFFGGEAKGTIPKQEFINRIKTMDIRNLRDNAITSLFDKLDANITGQLSENEFRSAFDDQDAAYQTREVHLSKEMSDEILQLFREIDTDNSNSLTIDELVKALSKMGANPTSEEANRLFQELDRNGDGKISYNEFRIAMEEKIKKDILHLEGLLSDLRDEFKKVDVYNRGVLTPPQLHQALTNLKIDLRQDELNALVQVIDKDRSGTIDIDEFLGFIMTPQDKNSFGTEADAAIMNIKRSRKLSLVEMLNSFKNMPHNFMMSFTRDLTRKLSNLPSSTMKPKLNSSGVFHVDIIPNMEKLSAGPNVTKFATNNPKILYNIKTIPSVLAAKITVNLATGVPIPAEQNVNRQASLIGRELRAVIFSRTTKKFIGNIASLQVEWDPTFEDRWNFLPTRTANENALLLRLTEFNPSKEFDAGLALVFEFVLFYKNNEQLIEMSSGWADIELSELRQTRVLDLKLKGGSPLREISINEADVISNRKGWRNVVKMLSTKPITSKLKIEVKTGDKMTIDVKNDLEYMPSTVIMNRNALSICKTYRNYLGSLLIEGQEKGLSVDLINDVLARTFRKIIDCPDTWLTVIRFWNNSVIANNVRAKLPSTTVEYLKILMKNLFLLFSHSDFGFHETDPCARIDFDPKLIENRRKLLGDYLENSLVDMQIRSETFRRNTNLSTSAQSSFKPFNINELMEDEYDLGVFEQLQNLRSNTTTKY